MARSIAFLVVFLMSLQLVEASVTALPATPDNTFTIHSEKRPSLLGNLIFQKVEEEGEEAGDDKNGIARAVLIDFSRVVSLLSSYHTPHVQVLSPAFQYDVRPPLHQFNCLFLI